MPTTSLSAAPNSAAKDAEAGSDSGRRIVAFLRAPFAAATWRRTAYGIASLPIAAVSFALVVPGIIASTALLAAFLLGVPFFLLFFGVARTLAGFHRSWVRVMLKVDVGTPEPLQVGGGPLRRWKSRCADLRTWRDVLFMIANLPISLVLLYLCAWPWVQTVYSLSYPIMQWNTQFGPGAWGGPSWIGAVAVHTLPGFVTLFLGPWLIQGATFVHRRWVRVMIGT